jgi:ribonuclease P protein component
MKYFLRKENRLSLQHQVDFLFSHGHGYFIYPIRAKVLVCDKNAENDAWFKLMVVVPKRYVKKSTSRNLIKRRIRESFRVAIHYLKDILPSNKIIVVAISFVSSNLKPYDKINESIEKLMREIERDFKMLNSVKRSTC